MAIFLLLDTTGGMSDEPPQTIASNQVQTAQNVHFWKAPLGARRNGSVQVMSGSLNAQFCAGSQANGSFVYTVDGSGFVTRWSSAMARQVITVSPADGLVVNATTPRGMFLAAHQKMFLAAFSTASRGHVVPAGSTSMRRTGLAAPVSSVTAVDTGSGSYTGTRYFRWRAVEIASGVLVRRSEPSPVLTKTPSGSGTGLVVTLPGAVPNEGETHWELEESINNADFYRLVTTVIGTTSVTDSTAYTSLALTGVLSADIGDYTLPPSARLILLDHDRVLMGGDYGNGNNDSDVVWTQPGNDPSGVGNDERIVAKYNPRVTLDADGAGDPLVDWAKYDGRVIVLKTSSIYSLTYTQANVNAYVSDIVSTSYGAMFRSVVAGVNARGNSALYFVDQKVGFMRYSAEGLEILAPQIQDTFVRQIDFTLSNIRGLQPYYNADQREIWWHFSMLDGTEQRWVYNTLTGAVTMHTFPGAGTVHSATPVSWSINSQPVNKLLSFGVINPANGFGAYLCNIPGATSDNGTPFRAYVRSRAFQPGQLVKRSEFSGLIVEADTTSGATLGVSFIRNYGVEQSAVVPFMVAASGVYTISVIDNVRLSEATSLQIEWGDPSGVSVAPWRVSRIAGNPATDVGSNI